MEKAISLTPPEAALIRPALLRRYGRVYVGSSFCQNLLPSAEDVRGLRVAGARSITLATPLLTGDGLRRFLKTMSRVLETENKVEVSVNDLGLLEAIRRRFRGRVTPLLGRPVSHDYIRMAPSFLAGFLKYYGINLLESDENVVVRGLAASSPFKVAFHYPGACLAMSRFCARTGTLSGTCARPCAGVSSVYHSGVKKFTLYCNAYFKSNAPCKAAAVSRLVFTPQISKSRR